MPNDEALKRVRELGGYYAFARAEELPRQVAAQAKVRRAGKVKKKELREKLN